MQRARTHEPDREPTTAPADEELIARAREGQAVAFEELVARYRGTVLSVAWKRLRNWEAAQELAQEVFLRAYVHRNTLREDAAFGPWITRITKNLAEDWARRQIFHSAVVEDLVAREQILHTMSPASPLHPREAATLNQERQLVDAAIERLPVRLRHLVIMHYVEELPKTEVARALKMHPSNVGRQLDRALEFLRRDLGPQFHPQEVREAAFAGSTAFVATLVGMSPMAVSKAQAATADTATIAASTVAPKVVAGAGGLAAFVGTRAFYFSAGAVLLFIGALSVRHFSSKPSTDRYRFPLAERVQPLSSAPSLPSGPKPPIVYVAPVVADSDARGSIAQVIRDVLLFQLLTPDASGVSGANVVPARLMTMPYASDTTPPTSIRLDRIPVAQLRDDARLLGSDVLLWGQLKDTTDSAVLKLELSGEEMAGGRQRHWSASFNEADIGSLLPGAMEFCASWSQSGTKGTDASLANLLKRTTLQQLVDASSGATTASAAIDQLLAAAPGCAFPYALGRGGEDQLDRLNAGLRRWPEDPRLLMTKLKWLREHRRVDIAVLFLSELLRSNPRSLIVLEEARRTLEFAYPLETLQSDVRPEPAAYTALQQLGQKLADSDSAGWVYPKLHGHISVGLARFLQGRRPIYRHEATRRQRSLDLYASGATALEKAIAIRGDSVPLLLEWIQARTGARTATSRWLDTIIERVLTKDPQEWRATHFAAAGVGYWWGNRDEAHFMRLLSEGIARHGDQPEALGGYASCIGGELTGRSWSGALTDEAIYGPGNPLVGLFIKATEDALNKGFQVENGVAGILRFIYERNGQQAKLTELLESGRHWALTSEEAGRAYAAGDYARAERLARKAYPNAPGDSARSIVTKRLVEALRAQKRDAEADKVARQGRP